MTHHRVAPTALGLLLVLVGLVVGTGGVWLMALGGSWYYLPAGLLLVLTGLLLLQGNPAALPTHALLLGLTLAWSLWESGLNAWALAARGDVLWVLGLAFIIGALSASQLLQSFVQLSTDTSPAFASYVYQMVTLGSPMLIVLGLATLTSTIVILAARWRRG